MFWASSPIPHLASPTSEGTPPAARSLPPAHLPDLGSQEYLQGEVERYSVQHDQGSWVFSFHMPDTQTVKHGASSISEPQTIPENAQEGHSLMGSGTCVLPEFSSETLM